MNRTAIDQTEFVDFYLPFGGHLKASNRWCRLAEMVPWDEVESCYADKLSGTGIGAPAKSGRIAYGALLIKERLGITDEETVEQISENPYLQYFLGLRELLNKALFDPSMMVHFRSRFSQEDHQRINASIIAAASGIEVQKMKIRATVMAQVVRLKTQEKLLVDATCTPADIRYPNDLGLLNEAREKSESYIDQLHKWAIQNKYPVLKKPRTYRQKARKRDLSVAKQKRAGQKKIRKAIGQQLNYLRRNFGHIDRMIDQYSGALNCLSAYDYKCLLVIRTLYDQQSEMYTRGIHTVKNRIVSISQPHVRPIVRGKAGKRVEFGAKVSISHQCNGYVSVDTLSWDAYNEGADLPRQIETYKKRFGYYPASVHADSLYRTGENRRYCQNLGIRLSGKPLGRPKKRTDENASELKVQRQLEYQDEIDRIAVEGKFGNCKRKGTLGRVMAKLDGTSESVIHVAIAVLNLNKWLAELLCAFLWYGKG